MLFSICTPTHKAEFLAETYRSILALDTSRGVQWEWILVCNGEPIPDGLLQTLKADTRVKLRTSAVKAISLSETVQVKPIGALKQEAFLQGEGSWLIELDHDDLLTPNALQRIAETLVRYPQASFIYSDNVHFNADGTSHIFPAACGWRPYSYAYPDMPSKEPGGLWQAQAHFPINASTLQSIGCAPDHVRCWQRDVYQSLGGHDASLPVCDDLDLMCRTYLGGYEMVHIPEVLYIYREHQQNSFRQMQGVVDKLSEELGDKYRTDMVKEWCRRQDYCMLDLGGAFNSPAGYQSVDVRGQVDHLRDVVRDGLPRCEQPIGCVRAVDFLEHVPSCNSRCDHRECVVSVMNNIYDNLVPGGWLLSETPSDTGRGASQDPTHVSRWNTNSWWYYCHPNWRRFIHDLRAQFIPNRVREYFPSEFHQVHNIPYIMAHVTADKGQHAMRRIWPIVDNGRRVK